MWRIARKADAPELPKARRRRTAKLEDEEPQETGKLLSRRIWQIIPPLEDCQIDGTFITHPKEPVELWTGASPQPTVREKEHIMQFGVAGKRSPASRYRQTLHTNRKSGRICGARRRRWCQASKRSSHQHRLRRCSLPVRGRRRRRSSRQTPRPKASRRRRAACHQTRMKMCQNSQRRSRKCKHQSSHRGFWQRGTMRDQRSRTSSRKMTYVNRQKSRTIQNWSPRWRE
jgi:hypothetical protein